MLPGMCHGSCRDIKSSCPVVLLRNSEEEPIGASNLNQVTTGLKPFDCAQSIAKLLLKNSTISHIIGILLTRKVTLIIDVFEVQTLSIEIRNAVTAIVALFEPRPERSKAFHFVLANDTEPL